MQVEENRVSHIGLIFILGLISMLMPLAIDMYLPSMPVIAKEFGVPAGSVQMTLSAYVLGFAVGQLFCGPMADSLGRKPVIFWGVLIFALAGAACALAQSVEQLVYMRFLHGLAAAAASVVIHL
ncbi:hypothetical protein AXF24_12750 [Streptococcus pneumoniae]|uniref:MFS transporter n=1 Tax=Streptococcus pneumoniae TaxID=1313 RepID=UPI00077254D7|nr:hypothetical protein AWW74_12765 [Streptococcus pneumoniae]KXB94557.1 hypothetical protein AXF24_12750 [Streptococcus pneumoniae]